MWLHSQWTTATVRCDCSGKAIFVTFPTTFPFYGVISSLWKSLKVNRARHRVTAVFVFHNRLRKTVFYSTNCQSLNYSPRMIKKEECVTHVSFLSYQGILEKNDRICLDFKWQCRRIFETFSLDRDWGTQSHYLSALPLESLSAQKKDTCLRDSPVFHVSKNTRLKKHFYPEHIFLKATNFFWVICSLHCTQTFVLKPPPPFSLTGLHN